MQRIPLPNLRIPIPIPIPQTPSSASTTLLFQNPYSQQKPPPFAPSTKSRPSSHDYKIPKRRFPPIFGCALPCSGAICVKKAQNFSPPLVRRMILAMLEETEINPPRSMCQAENLSICHLLKCPKNIIFVHTSRVPKKLSSTKNSWGTPISTSLTGAYTDAEEPRNYHSQSRRLLEVEEP